VDRHAPVALFHPAHGSERTAHAFGKGSLRDAAHRLREQADQAALPNQFG
jgi:hypothetical protein